MAREFTFNSNIEEVRINDQNGDLITVLRINKADPTTPRKFKEMAEKLQTKGTAYQNQSKALAKRAGDHPSLDELMPAFELRIQFCKEIGEEIDAIFGPGTVYAMTSKNREINPDFVPDEIWYADFIRMVMPIMGELFADHFKQAKEKYGVK